MCREPARMEAAADSCMKEVERWAASTWSRNQGTGA